MTDLDARRRKLAFRASHRGMKEMDVILGGYADRTLAVMSDVELDRFEALLEVPDPDLHAWIVGGLEVPSEHRGELMQELRAFRMRPEDYGDAQG